MTAIGTYFGVKVVNTKWWLGKPNLQKGAGKVALKRKAKKRNLQPVIGFLLAAVYTGVVVFLFAVGQNLLAIGAIAGAVFGILIERGQICFTSAFRDMWISGRAVMSKAIAVGMMVSVGFTFIYIQTGAAAQIIKIAAPSTVIGGLLFGFGIVLAGGCETGMMYRAMEGQVLFWVVGAGNIVGATLLAYGWDHLDIFNALAKD